ncbi:hypothetical protein [uncultured Nocardioides sp.]|uniref:hypothetical protein n=1 Tax=uncultured Nocardioides sp. TaxID=198441 RepID=UPI002613198A|nr:hypothetical protein [uncultured Nocardioides sp.]
MSGDDDTRSASASREGGEGARRRKLETSRDTHPGFVDEPLIDIRGLAAWFAVSESVVRKWSAKGPDSGLVPRFIRINGQIRFRPADVRDFLEQREVR